MEHLAWQLLETRQDVVAAERIFAQLANRARMNPSQVANSAASTSSSSASLLLPTVVQRLCTAVHLVHHPRPSAAHGTVPLTAFQCRDLAAAVLHPRFPNRVVFGMPETEEQLAKANHRILLCVHPDKGFVSSAEACVKLSQRKEECAGEIVELQEQRAEKEAAERAEKEQRDREKEFAESILRHDGLAASAPLSPRDEQMMAGAPPLSPPSGQNMFSTGFLSSSYSSSSMQQASSSLSSFELPGASTSTGGSTFALPRLSTRFAKPPNFSPSRARAATNSGTSSFASPTQRPLPAGAGFNSVSAAAADPPGSPRRTPVGTPTKRVASSQSRRKKKPPSAEKQFETMLSSLRERAGAGVKLTSCSDYFEQQRYVREQLGEEGSPLQQHGDDEHGDGGVEGEDEHEAVRRVEESMRSLLSNLKDKNSKVQLSVRMHDVDDDQQQTAVAANSSGVNEQGVFVQQQQQQQHHHDHNPTACRDFVVKRAQQMMKGHLESFAEGGGDGNIIDTNLIAAAVGEAALASSKSGSDFAVSASATPKKNSVAATRNGAHPSPPAQKMATTSPRHMHQRVVRGTTVGGSGGSSKAAAAASLTLGPESNLYRRRK